MFQESNLLGYIGNYRGDTGNNIQVDRTGVILQCSKLPKDWRDPVLPTFFDSLSSNEILPSCDMANATGIVKYTIIDVVGYSSNISDIINFYSYVDYGYC